MSVRVLKDGQLVHRSYGDAVIGPTDRKVSLGTAVVCAKNQELRDNEISTELLELVKSGDHPGLTYLGPDDDEDEGGSGDAVIGAPSADGGTEDENKSEDKLYDPRDHTQAQVLDYLKDADPEEVMRVQELEAGTQKRQKIAEFKAESK